jgi:hypothetical protein
VGINRQRGITLVGDLVFWCEGESTNSINGTLKVNARKNSKYKNNSAQAFTLGLAVMPVHFIYYVKPQGT